MAIINWAYALGYDGIELDVRLSKDKELVLMHDAKIDKTTNGTGWVSKHTAEELRAIALKDAWGGPPSYVESFEDALRLNGDRGYVMPDLRDPAPEAVDAMHRALDRSEFAESKLLFIAYSAEPGAMLKREFPKAVVMLKAPSALKPPALTNAFADEAVGLDGVLVPTASFPEITHSFKERTDQLGLKLGVYLHHRGPAATRGLIEAGVFSVTGMVNHHVAVRKELATSTAPDVAQSP